MSDLFDVTSVAMRLAHKPKHYTSNERRLARGVVALSERVSELEARLRRVDEWFTQQLLSADFHHETSTVVSWLERGQRIARGEDT